MESIDIIKLLKEEQKEKDIARTNEGEEKDLSNMFEYYDKFIKPKIDRLVSQGKLQDNELRDYPFVMHIIQLFLTLDNGFGHIDKEDFYIYPFLMEYYSKKGTDNLNVLETKDKNFKEEVANTICEVLLVRQKTKNVSGYFKMYIEPLLVELNKQGKIIYDMTSTDNMTIETSEKVKTITSSVLGITSSQLIINDIDEMPKDDIQDMLYELFFKDDNIELKKEYAKLFCNDFLRFYKSNDFTKLSIDELQEILNNELFIQN